MDESKHRKNFLNELKPEERQKGFGKMPAMVVFTVEKPFIFIQAQYAGKLTETSLKKMVAEELRDKMIFIDSDGFSSGD